MDSDFNLKKDSNYYICERKELLSLIPSDIQYILDIGCGDGGLCRNLKKKLPAKKTVGIEINIDAAQRAKEHIDEVIITDIEKTRLNFSNGYFDLIIYADVLEHLVNPWKIIAEMKQYLKKTGYYLISVPNIRYYRVLCDILFNGEFKYEKDGILDITHLRFFTLKMLKLYLAQINFEVVKIKRNYSGYITWILNKICFNLFSDFFTRQYIILAKPQK